MKRVDLIYEMAQTAQISKEKAQEILEVILSSIKSTLKKGKPVKLLGFGTFHVGERAARINRNPRTGALIESRKRKVAKFRPGSALRSAVVMLNSSLPGEPTTKRIRKMPNKPKKLEKKVVTNKPRV